MLAIDRIVLTKIQPNIAMHCPPKSKLCAANQKHNPTLPGQNLPHNATAISESDTKTFKCIFNLFSPIFDFD